MSKRLVEPYRDGQAVPAAGLQVVRVVAAGFSARGTRNTMATRYWVRWDCCSDYGEISHAAIKARLRAGRLGCYRCDRHAHAGAPKPAPKPAPSWPKPRATPCGYLMDADHCGANPGHAPSTATPN